MWALGLVEVAVLSVLKPGASHGLRRCRRLPASKGTLWRVQNSQDGLSPGQSISTLLKQLHPCIHRMPFDTALSKLLASTQMAQQPFSSGDWWLAALLVVIADKKMPRRLRRGNCIDWESVLRLLFA